MAWVLATPRAPIHEVNMKTDRQALVLIAHGSRRQASNQEVMDLASRLQQSAGGHYQLIEAGFLEIAAPSIPEAIESCIESGATAVVVVPYFLAAGRHVAEDIPQIVQPVAERHPAVSIRIAAHIGLSDSMPRLILESADSRAATVIGADLDQAG
jgi:sirohydrochlorin ferrochelatase